MSADTEPTKQEIRESRLQELEERLDRLEERASEPEPPKIKGTRRQFLGVMTLGTLAALLPGVTTAQTPSETAAQQYCVMQGPVEARPEPQEGCRWIYLEGDPDQPNSQVIRFTEGEAWHLFDNVPKNLYGRGYPDHPDYGSLDNVLDDADLALLRLEENNKYGDVTMPSSTAMMGGGFKSELASVTTDGNNLIFFVGWPDSADTIALDEHCGLTFSYATNAQDITLQIQNDLLFGMYMLTNSVTIDGDACRMGYCGNVISFTSIDVTINGDNNIVSNNSRVSVTNNGSGNVVTDNT